MSRIKEGIKNIDKVGKAIVRRVLDIDSELAIERKRICDTCFNSVEDKIFGGTMCDVCLCNIETKVYSEENCPIDKW